MSDAVDSATGLEDTASLQARLAGLRSQGAWRLDPARFYFMEALSRRLPDQPEPVRRMLQDKLQAGVVDFAQRHAQALQAGTPPGAQPAATPAMGAACTRLAQLNQYIRAVAKPEPTSAGVAAVPGALHELASVRRFRRVWSNHRTQDQVAQAGARKPSQAGPLNSHALVLQSLALMGELSPDYLRRFLTQVESLQWLDLANAKYPPPAGKQAKAAATRPKRTKKQG